MSQVLCLDVLAEPASTSQPNWCTCSASASRITGATGMNT